ncbi:MAG: diacylglycerol kinase [Planctomycetota bacterium]|nr:MAG: diacylglycerol kinase [Planctomycetota bacterium]
MKTRSLWHSFACAFAGLRDVVRSGRNAKIHVVIALAVVAAGFCLKITRTEWAILLLTIGAVFAAEAANTALESVVDLVSPDHHDLARRAKDCAAGAVLVMAITAVAVGLLVLGPPLAKMIWFAF